MAITDKNTIYSWFQTDDFPTEAQFRATWDSFWHKSESIPMSQITGLNQLFQQTATVAQLNNKANVDGSNIDVSAYQEKLNITNLIATAKEEVKNELLNGAPEAFDTLKEISDWISDDETAEAAILQAIQNEATARTNADNQKLDKGNYTGTAQDLKTEIGGKLTKPTTTSNTTSYPFVVGEDGNGNSARLPAGDLGKNFFNSDLSNTTARNHTMNAGVTINTLGNPYSITGLPNKESDTTNFDKVLKYNPSTGQFAYGQAFVYNVPSTITVNHINAPASPDVPSYVQAIQNRITELNSSSMQKFNNWIVETEGGITNANIKVQNNDTVYTTLNPYYGSGLPLGKILTNIKTGLVLPTNADWAISFNVNMGNDAYGGNVEGVLNRLVGIYSDSGALISPAFYFRDSNSYWRNLGVLTIEGATSSIVASTISELANCMVIKVGNVLYFNAQVGGVKSTSSTIDIGNLILNSPNVGFVVANAFTNFSNANQKTALVSNIKYYIFP